MTGPTDVARRGRALATIVLTLLWATALIVMGTMSMEAPWGRVCFGTGILCVLLVAVGAAAGSWTVSVFGVLATTAIGLITAGGMLGEVSLIGSGILALVVVGAAVALAALLGGLGGLAPGTAPSGFERIEPLLHQIHEHGMLSDNAKRVLYRERELGLLRQAIEGDLGAGKYDAALALCDEMAGVFGYLEEAESFRGRVLQARQERFDMEARAALAHLGDLLGQRDWAAVHQEAARIRRLFGDSHHVQDLDRRIIAAREEHKNELESAFLQAAERDDVEGAMKILKTLDRYLDQHEAARLAEVAQGVVARHRENLGVQFKLAVNDRRWGEAARIGESLVEEFPNTKMAEEVRSMIEVLRTRATQAALSSGGSL